MADNGFRLTVLTEEKAVVDQTIRSLIAPGTEGYLGVWRNHAPLVTGLMPGRLTVIQTDTPRDYAVAGGFLEIRNNVVTLLADALEAIDDIDVPRAEAAAGRARERLNTRGPDIDVERAEASLKRALNRMRLAGRP